MHISTVHWSIHKVLLEEKITNSLIISKLMVVPSKNLLLKSRLTKSLKVKSLAKTFPPFSFVLAPYVAWSGWWPHMRKHISNQANHNNYNRYDTLLYMKKTSGNSFQVPRYIICNWHHYFEVKYSAWVDYLLFEVCCTWASNQTH